LARRDPDRVRDVEVEVGLADGTKLVLANANTREDDVVKAVRDDPTGVVSLVTDSGTYRVLVRNVVYIRTVD
jgi:hypothetical protein